MSENEKVLVSCEEMSIGYGKKEIVSQINVKIHQGSLWGLIGPNGAGKTTFIRTLLGNLKPIKGKCVQNSNIRFGYVKQRDSLNITYPFTVFEVVLMGRYGEIPFLKKRTKTDLEKVEFALEQTGIEELRNIPVRNLSGGQRQRVLIARALASQPEILILDEPTNDMDIAGEEAVLQLIRKVHEETKTAILFISHLLPVVFRVAENILFLHEQKLNAFSKSTFIAENLLTKFYQMPIEIIEHKGNRYSIASLNEFEMSKPF